MKELIEKLRDTASKGVSVWGDIQMDAADTIERLERDLVAADIRIANDALEIDKHCNCEFEGDVNTVQCTLHNAWAETLHEQGTYRRERDALKADLAKAQEATVNNCARVLELANEIAGWKADQAENLENQCALVAQLLAMTAERDALYLDAQRYRSMGGVL